jgi:hypothetical protein
MNPKTKQRLNGITAKLTPLERQLKEFIRDEQDNLSIRELDYLIQAECSISEAYAFIQQTK